MECLYTIVPKLLKPKYIRKVDMEGFAFHPWVDTRVALDPTQFQHQVTEGGRDPNLHKRRRFSRQHMRHEPRGHDSESSGAILASSN